MKSGRSKIVIFASGSGSNFQNIVLRTQKNELPIKVVALVTNVASCLAIERAQTLGIPVICIESKGLSRSEHERRLLEALSRVEFDWIVLAGYMRVFTRDFLERFHDSGLGLNRVINVHPSLLPEFRGVDAFKQAFEAKAKKTGVSVHFVTAEVDGGPIIAQKAFTIEANDTLEDVRAKGQKIEHEIYPTAIQKIVTERFTIEKTASGSQRVKLLEEET